MNDTALSPAQRSPRADKSAVAAPSRNDRRHQRFELPEGREHLCGDGEGSLCVLKDISQGGLGFFSDHSYRRGEYVDLHVMDFLRVQVRVQYREPMHWSGETPAHHKYRYGARFAEQVMSPASLATFLEHYLMGAGTEPGAPPSPEESGAAG